MKIVKHLKHNKYVYAGLILYVCMFYVAICQAFPNTTLNLHGFHRLLPALIRVWALTIVALIYIMIQSLREDKERVKAELDKWNGE